MHTLTVTSERPLVWSYAVIGQCSCGQFLTAVSSNESTAKALLRRKHRVHVKKESC